METKTFILHPHQIYARHEMGKKAFNEQFVWGQRDNFWNQAGERKNTVSKGNYWLAGMQNMAKNMWYDIAIKTWV